MAKRMGCLAPAFLGAFGLLCGAAVAIILRPSYPVGSLHYSADPDLGRPTLPIMFQRGLAGTDPTDRAALIYLLLGIVLGGLIGALLGYLISRKRAQRSS